MVFARGSRRLALVTLVSAAAAAHGAAQTGKIDGDRLLDPTRLLEVEITLPADDWDRLRVQARDPVAFFAGRAVDDPYVYYEADLRLDGREIQSVGVRKKGLFGSLDDQRPSLKIKFNEFVDQDPVEGLNRLTLNNNKQDTSQLSQYLSYKLFRDAGVHAPRCSMALVTVNGESLGIYSHVESIKKPFLERSFGDDRGNLFEGTLTDFHPRAIDKIEVKTNKKKDDRSDLMRLAELLAAPELTTDALEQVIDLDEFLRYWALESILRFWDGYASNQNNYYYYVDPQTDLGHFIPWGADNSFGSGGFGGFGGFGGQRGTAIYAQSILCNRAYHIEGMPERYRETMLELLDEVWDEQVLLAEIEAIEPLIEEHLHGSQSNASGALDDLHDFVLSRREQLEQELEDWPAEVPARPRKPSYTVPVGAVEGTFTAEWSDEAVAEPSRTGSAKLEIELDGEALEFERMGVSARKYEAPRFGGFGGGLGGGRGFGRGFGRGRGSRPEPPAQVSLTLSGVRGGGEEPLTIDLTLLRTVFEAASGDEIEVTGRLREGRGGRRGGFGFGFGGAPNRSVVGTLCLTKSGTTAGSEIVGELELVISEARGGFFAPGGRLPE